MRHALVVAVSLALCSCATIFHGGRDTVSINTVPPGARVTIVNRKGTAIDSGITPFSTNLETGYTYFVPATYTIEATMPGYETRRAEIGATLNPWYICNIFIGGAVGMLIVDPATGAMYSLTPKTVSLEMLQFSGATIPLTPTGAIDEQLRVLDRQLFDATITNAEYATRRDQLLRGSMR